jgi:signal peptidase I
VSNESLEYDVRMNPEIAPSTPKKTFLQDLKEVIVFALIVLAILIPLRLYVAQPFIVVGASMEPTFDTGQYLIVDELTYRVKDPERGQVIIFKYPKDPSKYFIKRIIGLPGETVILKDETVTIKNSTNPEGFRLNESYITFKKGADQTTVLKSDEYFVMGDNRPVSLDSRSWGPLPKDHIIGRALVRLLPISTISLLPGNHTQ